MYIFILRNFLILLNMDIGRVISEKCETVSRIYITMTDVKGQREFNYLPS